MQIRQNKIIPLYIILILVAVYSLIFPLFTGGFFRKDILLRAEPSDDFNNEITYYNGNGDIVMPDNAKNLPILANEAYTFSKTLTDVGYTNNSLGIYMLHNAVRVYIDNDLIFEDGHNPDGTAKRFPINYWEIIPLPPDIEGKVLTIEFMSAFEKYSGYIPNMKFGSQNTVVAEIKNTYFAAFILSCVSFLVSIIIICVYFGMGKFKQDNRNFLYLGFLTLIVSVWLMAETDYLQFFINNTAFITSDSYIFLILVPIPMILYIESVFKLHNTFFSRCLYWIFVIYATVSILLHMFNIVFFFETLIFFHIAVIIMLLYYTCAIPYEIKKYKNKDALVSLLEMSVFFIFAVLEMINYYSPEPMQIGSFFRIGLLIFLAQSVFTTLKKLRVQYEKSREAQYFEKLAYIDMLTGGKNRTAFERDLTRFSRPRMTDLTTWLVILDANNLKAVNDTMGHVAGDSYLEFTYNHIVLAFKGHNAVYRIGGDEFACILSNMTKADMETRVIKLQEEIVCFSKEQNTGIAIGFAVYEKDKYPSIADFIHNVDNMMYENKKMIKFKTIN